MSYRNLQDEIRALTYLDKLKLQRYLSQLILKVYEEMEAEPVLTFDEQMEAFKEEFGLTEIKLIFSEKIINEMSKETDKIDFFGAFRLAIQSFITDGDGLDSFYGLIRETPEHFGLTSPVNDQEVQEVIRKALQEKRTEITLVTPETQFQPENGESPDENWIFLVENTSIAFGLNWAIVNRKTKEVYNYGYN